MFNISSWTTLQQTCLSHQPRVQFFRSLANITDAFVTVSRAYLNNEDGGAGAGAGVNAAKTAYYGAELKEINYLADMIGQVTTDIAPGLRAAAAGGGAGRPPAARPPIAALHPPRPRPIPGRVPTAFTAPSPGASTARCTLLRCRPDYFVHSFIINRTFY